MAESSTMEVIERIMYIDLWVRESNDHPGIDLSCTAVKG
jgi:hypothetical protein